MSFIPDRYFLDILTSSQTITDSSAPYTLVTIPSGETYTIISSDLVATLTGNKLGSFVYIRGQITCGNTDLLNVYANIEGINEAGSPLATTQDNQIHKCTSNVILDETVNNTTLWEIFGSVNYIPYDVASSTSNMATNTPYMIQKIFDSGNEYTYNPLLSQVGIFGWFILTLVITLCFVKIFRKW